MSYAFIPLKNNLPSTVKTRNAYVQGTSKFLIQTFRRDRIYLDKHKLPYDAWS